MRSTTAGTSYGGTSYGSEAHNYASPATTYPPSTGAPAYAYAPSASAYTQSSAQDYGRQPYSDYDEHASVVDQQVGGLSSHGHGDDDVGYARRPEGPLGVVNRDY